MESATLTWQAGKITLKVVSLVAGALGAVGAVLRAGAGLDGIQGAELGSPPHSSAAGGPWPPGRAAPYGQVVDGSDLGGGEGHGQTRKRFDCT